MTRSRFAMLSSTKVTATMSDEHRLHPLSWLFAAARSAKGFIIPLLVVLFASGGNAYEFWAAVFIVPVAAGAVLQYIVFRYRLGPDELVVRDGIFTRTERHIPYDRIQNIDLVQNPFHRLMHVALVHVETASGTKSEAVIRVLSLEAVDEMRTRVFAGRQRAGTERETEEQSPDTLLRLSAGESIRLGIVSNKGLAVVGAVVGLLWQQGQVWNQDPEAQEAFLEQYLGAAPQSFGSMGETSLVAVALLAMAAVVLAIMVLRLLSIGWFLVQLHEFTLTKRDDELRVEHGLFTRITRTIPTPRIQTLTTIETPVHRWFGRQTVKLRTVGGGGDGGDLGVESAAGKARDQWLAPMIETARVPALVRQVLPEVTIDALKWEPLAHGARHRILLRLWTGVAAVTVVASVVIDPRIVALGFTLPAAALAYIHTRLYMRHAGYSVTPWGIAFKSGWWNRTLKLVRYSKIQTVARGETPFGRRNGMASVRIDTAGAHSLGHTIEIPYLDFTVATEMSRRLYREASRRSFRW